MRIKKFPPFVGGLCILGLLLVCYLDPVRNYPQHEVEMILFPNETVTVNIPTMTTLFFGLEQYVYPLLHPWIKSHTGNLYAVDYDLVLTDEAMFQLPDTKILCAIQNRGTDVVYAQILTIRAPSPDNQGSYKNYMYVATGMIEVIVLVLFTIFNKAMSLEENPDDKNFYNSMKSFLSTIFFVKLWKKVADKSRERYRASKAQPL